MDEGQFFEGPEKLMEIWWKPLASGMAEITRNETENKSDSTEEKVSGDLRTIPRKKWEEILKLVNCEIVSEKRNKDMVAYLLSESSMFVSKERLILKTCGKTTLLYSVKPIIDLVREECGLAEVLDFFYSRKNYKAPDLQDGSHQSFETETALLDKLFSNGAAYMVGRLNGDRWYLYTVINAKEGVNVPDQTLEILMQDLDPAAMKPFYKKHVADANEATKISGIADFVPGALIDDALFDPCGYSLNGMIDDSYFTVHITPQPEFSYASFETNIKYACYKELISKVLKAFKPGKFLMTLFVNQSAPCRSTNEIFEEGCISDFKRTDWQLIMMKNYNLSFGNYVCANGSAE